MRVLLDTHMLIWMFADDSMLSASARDLILDYGNQLYCSAASVWEVQLKHEKRPKGTIDAQRFAEYCEKSQVAMLPVTSDHVAAIDSLPKVHKDPFDRLLIAQAAVEGMRFMTHDRVIGEYGLPFIINA